MAYQAPVANTEAKTVVGYLNLYLPRQNGARMKVGAVSLRSSSEDQQKLADFIAASPDNLAKVIGKLQVEYQSTTRAEGSELDL